LCDWHPIGMNIVELVDHLLKVGPYDQPYALTTQEETSPSLDKEGTGVPPPRNQTA